MKRSISDFIYDYFSHSRGQTSGYSLGLGGAYRRYSYTWRYPLVGLNVHGKHFPLSSPSGDGARAQRPRCSDVGWTSDLLFRYLLLPKSRIWE